MGYTRVISSPEVPGAESGIKILADELNAQHGHASHHYACEWTEPDDRRGYCLIHLQDGPIKEVGVNGITNEILLAVVIDRLECFQAGQFACEENAFALEAIKSALSMLQYRTQRRLERGVEGTHNK